MSAHDQRGCSEDLDGTLLAVTLGLLAGGLAAYFAGWAYPLWIGPLFEAPDDDAVLQYTFEAIAFAVLVWTGVVALFLFVHRARRARRAKDSEIREG